MAPAGGSSTIGTGPRNVWRSGPLPLYESPNGTSLMALDDILADFDILDTWEDRYRYVIELGKSLPEMPAGEMTDANKVRGCASQVWLVTETEGRGPDAVLTFRGTSDAHIVKGLIAIMFALYSGRRAAEIVTLDPFETLARIGLKEHLTSQRANGLRAMTDRIHADAGRAMRAAA